MKGKIKHEHEDKIKSIEFIITLAYGIILGLMLTKVFLLPKEKESGLRIIWMTKQKPKAGKNLQRRY